MGRPLMKTLSQADQDKIYFKNLEAVTGRNLVKA